MSREFFNDLIERFRSVSDTMSLDYDDYVTLHNSRIIPPLPQEKVDEFGKMFNLPQEIVDFYSVCNGIEFEWQLNEIEGKFDSIGHIELIGIDRIFDNWEGIVWFEGDDELNNIMGYDAKKIRPINRFAPEACDAFYEKEKGKYELIYFYYGEDIVSLPFKDFKEYIEFLFKTKGLFYGSKTFAQKKSINGVIDEVCDLFGIEGHKDIIKKILSLEK